MPGFRREPGLEPGLRQGLGPEPVGRRALPQENLWQGLALGREVPVPPAPEQRQGEERLRLGVPRTQRAPPPYRPEPTEAGTEPGITPIPFNILSKSLRK